MNQTELQAARSECVGILEGVERVFVGRRDILERVLAAALANGHILFEDYPGLGKTLLAKVFARAIGCPFSRVQFTPDLLPSDILGVRIWRPQSGIFELVPGPVFTNILLADEINRSPPKTQAALLEAMEERQVTIEGETHRLREPFLVLATQNPVEQEGTYVLPEAQMDRFMFRLSPGYAGSLEEESQILLRRVQWRRDDPSREVEPAVTQDQFLRLQRMVEENVEIAPSLVEYITRLVRETRKHARVEVGSSPRGGIALLKASRAMALIHGRDFVTPDDIKGIAVEGLAHRVILNVEDVLEGVREEKVIEEVLERVPVPTDVFRRTG